MGKMLKEYIKYIENIDEKTIDCKDRKVIIEDLLIQISFFQHERLIHVIVTFSFAIIDFLAIIATLILKQYAFLFLFVIIFVVLVFYVKHYYTLETGVQRLYKNYNRLNLK